MTFYFGVIAEISVTKCLLKMDEHPTFQAKDQEFILGKKDTLGEKAQPQDQLTFLLEVTASVIMNHSFSWQNWPDAQVQLQLEGMDLASAILNSCLHSWPWEMHRVKGN